MNSKDLDDKSLVLLRGVAVLLLVVGAAGAEGLMLHVGSHNPSYLLLVLFTGWDLSPFAALALAHLVSKRWSVLHRTTLYAVTIVIAAGSLAIYGNVVFSPPKSAPAFMFLAVPVVSWILLAIAVGIGTFFSRRRFHDAAA